MIYVIRHGQTDWNLNGRIQGCKNIPINETGKKQAQGIGSQIKDIKFDYIFCSPLKRTRQTLNIVYPQKSRGLIKPVYDSRLIERSFGELEGKFKSEVNDYSSFWNINTPHTWKNAEPLPDFLKRIWAFMDELISDKGATKKNILIVTHGGVISAIANWRQAQPEDGNYQRFIKSNDEFLIINLSAKNFNIK